MVTCVIGDVSAFIIFVLDVLTICYYYNLRVLRVFFQNLDAAGNSLTGTFPTELGQLSSALSIDLSKLLVMMMKTIFYLIITKIKSFHVTITLMLRDMITMYPTFLQLIQQATCSLVLFHPKLH